MHVVRYEDPKEFAARTEPVLVAEKARHNLLLGMTATLIERAEAYPDLQPASRRHAGPAGSDVVGSLHSSPYGCGR
jgi:hypothetical protein